MSMYPSKILTFLLKETLPCQYCLDWDCRLAKYNHPVDCSYFFPLDLSFLS